MSFEKELVWTRRHMSRTAAVMADFPNVNGRKIAISTHLDIKMLSFFEAYLKLGGELFITTCNPTTVRNEVVEYLVSLGAESHAWKDMSQQEWNASFHAALEWQPEYLCEFGAQLSRLYHSQRDYFGVVAALEGTGTGIAALCNEDLRLPVFNWDDLDAKSNLHNRHMVGLSAWQAFMDKTHLSLHEKKVVIVGYGQVGQGCAFAAKAFGGQVLIAEKDPSRQLTAAYDGWHCEELETGISRADVIVTATGVADVLPESLLRQLKAGAFVLNVGHVSHEIRLDQLNDYDSEEVMPEIYEYKKQNHHFFALSNGAMFNLTAGYGDSLNAFDVSLALMAAGVRHMVSIKPSEPGLYLLPDEAWKPYL